MSKIEKINKLSLLFDTYKNLLTDNQKNTFIKYFLEDYSLSELAELNKTSKASVADNLKTVEKKLVNLEEKLKFVDKYEKISLVINDLEKNNDSNIAKKLRKIYE